MLDFAFGKEIKGFFFLIFKDWISQMYLDYGFEKEESRQSISDDKN